MIDKIDETIESLTQLITEAQMLLRISLEIKEAVAIAPRDKSGVITSLTLSQEAIDFLASYMKASSPGKMFGAMSGVKILLKE